MTGKRKCKDCRWFDRCKWLIGAKDDWLECDWYPSRWSPKKEENDV
ncbi:hypothetical protein GM661_00375 [Iocasia frigidifontis]|uniref:Uncharacterized protein n=1 Tax=Iocasia fonsfrigidae TaxID=2682810 RepID=A0A8A7KB17_9FIRM|nr:hypothetical protein [Iocasia fonsfrigidae]QTL96529.1 hypothetical protein GM661_00375 [Iocasia fonsfrigidae]